MQNHARKKKKYEKKREEKGKKRESCVCGMGMCRQNFYATENPWYQQNISIAWVAYFKRRGYLHAYLNRGINGLT
jgi:hypothetical protein